MAKENKETTESREVVEYAKSQELSITDVKNQVVKIQQLMSEVLQEGQHYGTIPGADKPSLWKPGAEKINFLFRIGTGNLEITKLDLPNGHREITVKTPMKHIPKDTIICYGIGSCSTMESKYRYRNVSDYEITGQKIPDDAKAKKSEYRKKGYGMKKVDGSWEWVKYTSTQKEENLDIADVYNTVLKMAAKRSYVDGTIKASAASDFFTQDIEDFVDEEPETKPQQKQNKIVPEKRQSDIKGTAEVVDSTPQPLSEREQMHKNLCDWKEKGLVPDKIGNMTGIKLAVTNIIKFLERDEPEKNIEKWNKAKEIVKAIRDTIPTTVQEDIF
jgi:hypothetical protein